MADIFISYDNSDLSKARALAEALEEAGYSVWWDQKILPGKHFEEEIEKALNNADCVIVLWSRESVKSDWVKEEADEGKRRRILVPASLDDSNIPFGFKKIQTANLINWVKGMPHSGFDRLLDAVEDITGFAPLTKEVESERVLSDELEGLEIVSVTEMAAEIVAAQASHLEMSVHKIDTALQKTFQALLRITRTKGRSRIASRIAQMAAKIVAEKASHVEMSADEMVAAIEMTAEDLWNLVRTGD